MLPDELAADEDRIARFEREAKLLASLNHPNIAGIYGLERNALVLELVEGPTLAEQIEQGPIPVDETIAIAKQIADALEAGHEAGVIHRDLKPANIKIKEDGTVKVLDYGLAKALEGETPTGADSELSQSPTLVRQGTHVGVILGTAAYMSPEQARGKPVDRRADIWAFGAVLYEMLTGRRAFAGEDMTDTLAAVVRSEPSWDALPDGLSPTLQVYLRRCLHKDPKERVGDIRDVRLAMEGAFETSVSPVADAGVPKPRAWRRALPSVGGIVLGALVTGGAVWRLTRPEPPPVSRFAIAVGSLVTTGRSTSVALSPDGRTLVYMAGSEGESNRQAYQRRFDQLEAIPVRGTEDAGDPFFSPDGEWLGFWVLCRTGAEEGVFRRGRACDAHTYRVQLSAGRLGARRHHRVWKRWRLVARRRGRRDRT